MRRPLLCLSLILALLSGCASVGTGPDNLGAAVPGSAVLAQGNRMVEDGEIIRGACWDYIDTAYKRAGFPEAKRKVVFKSKKAGPYADASLIQPGDWLYHINHSYKNIEHSGIFVEWEDRSAKQGRTLSYAGEKRREPGRYRVYDLRSVYQITRPRP